MMNRSFRATEVQKHQQQRSRSPLPLQRGKSLGAVIKEKDEELALFLEMRKREKERNSNLLGNHSDVLDRPPGSKPGTSPIFKIFPTRRTFTDEFLGGSDTEKNDYDWLLTPPGTPLFPCLEKQSPPANIRTPKARPTVLKSRLSNLHDPATRGNSVSRQPTSSSSSSSSFVGNRRSSTSGGPTSVSSRPATPTRRSTLPATSRTSRPTTPTSRATLPATSRTSRPTTPTSRATLPPTSRTSRPSTPTSRATLPSRPAAPPRSSTPVRSSTPTSRSSAPPSKKPVSRTATPTRRSSAPASVPRSSSVPTHSSSVIKNAPVMSKTSVPTRGSSPTLKSRPWKPLEIPGFSVDTPPNLRTSLPERPLSASRGRPGAPTSRSSSVEPGPVARPRRQSCSPLRGRAPNGSVHQSGSSVPAAARSRVNGKSNPSLIGNKTSEKIIPARKLPPPKQNNQQRSGLYNPTTKSSLSPDSSGFGRTMSKKSLDMAMRHMDIRRSIPNNLRPLMRNVPASSMYSVRSGSAKSRGISVSDSPLATSSNASSESVNNSNIYHEGNELEDYDIRIGKAKPSSPTEFLAR